MFTHLQHFTVSVIVTVLFPLLPLIIEFKYGSFISEQSVLIASIMYCTAIALGSGSILVFVGGCITAIFLAIDYGSRLPTFTVPMEASLSFSAICMVLFAIAQVVKCFNSHVTQRQNFVYFPKVPK